MWKNHVFYESRPRSVNITLGGQLYRVLEVVSLISVKKCIKVVSQTKMFFHFMVQSKGEWKVIVTTKTSARGLSTQQQQVYKIVEEYKDIFSSPNGVSFHCPVEH
jgi:hypothetical protein